MSFDKFLADRMRLVLKEKQIPFKENQMMGGLAFMVQDKMCVGIIKNNMVARIAPELYDDALTKRGCRPMDFTGKPMRGWIFIEPEAIDLDKDLSKWIQLALDFNPRVKATKKK